MTEAAQRCLVLLCALFVVEFGGLAVVPSGRPASRQQGTPQTSPDLRAAGQRLGIPTQALERLHPRWGLPQGVHEPQSGYVSAVYRDGAIYLRPGTNATDAVAYEYLHDVWAHLSPEQRARLVLLLDQFYVEHRDELEPALGKLVRADVSNGSTPTSAHLDELHSIACSRTSDDHLSPRLRSYCDFVLPGRGVTTKKY